MFGGIVVAIVAVVDSGGGVNPSKQQLAVNCYNCCFCDGSSSTIIAGDDTHETLSCAQCYGRFE